MRKKVIEQKQLSAPQLNVELKSERLPYKVYQIWKNPLKQYTGVHTLPCQRTKGFKEWQLLTFHILLSSSFTANNANWNAN